MIETAGNHRSVRENTDLIPQTVAPHAAVGCLCVSVGPVEDLLPFQIAQRRQPDAPRRILPCIGEEFACRFYDLAVQTVLRRPIGAILVPQPQSGDRAACGGFFCKSEACGEVSACRVRHLRPEIGFPGVEGDADLVQLRRQQFVRPLRDLRAVGGQRRVQLLLPQDSQKFPQLRMQKRLTHQMQVDILGQRRDFFYGNTELFGGHEMRGAFCLRTERACQIADVGDFYVYFVQKQKPPYFVRLCSKMLLHFG